MYHSRISCTLKVPCVQLDEQQDDRPWYRWINRKRTGMVSSLLTGLSLVVRFQYASSLSDTCGTFHGPDNLVTKLWVILLESWRTTLNLQKCMLSGLSQIPTLVKDPGKQSEHATDIWLGSLLCVILPHRGQRPGAQNFFGQPGWQWGSWCSIFLLKGQYNIFSGSLMLTDNRDHL
jgi:hypothetical protein